MTSAFCFLGKLKDRFKIKIFLWQGKIGKNISCMPLVRSDTHWVIVKLNKIKF